MRRLLPRWRTRTLPAVLGLLVSSAAGCGNAPRASPAGGTAATPVSGPSWLARLGLTVETSALGQMGGTAGAPETARREPMPSLPPAPGSFTRMMRRLGWNSRPAPVAESSEPFVLAGADLYRLNCQACHGPDGLGKPPEINSLLDPIRGTSALLLTQRLAARGGPVDDVFVQEVVAGARRDVLQRLAEGGKAMPPFKQLGHEETPAILAYLDRLAEVPDAPSAPALVTDPVVRVGELVVKGTCHVCHDATGGPRGRMAVMMSDATPSLESVANDYDAADVIAKVRDGSSGRMGMMRRETKMPRFPYLTPEEIAAALAYLKAHPPQPSNDIHG